MTEELEQKAEESAKQNCPMPMNWNEIDVAERTGYVKGYIAGATEVTKELQEQIEKLNKELEEYKNIDKRLICNHKYFTSDIKNNNLAVICHSILSCDMCGRWEEK